MNIEVRIISLGTGNDQMFRQIGFTNVERVPAVDYRKESPLNLYQQGKITINAMDTWSGGSRKWSREFVGGGAVGLQQSMIKVLSRDREDEVWTLMCEEDCVPKHNLHTVVSKLILSYESCPFDVAIIGPFVFDSKPSCITGFGYPKKVFFGTHCLLVAPEAHSLLIDKLSRPQEVQVDSYIAQLALVGELKVLVQTSKPSAAQSFTPSTIQTSCPLCSVSAAGGCGRSGHKASILWFLMGMVCIMIILFVSGASLGYMSSGTEGSESAR